MLVLDQLNKGDHGLRALAWIALAALGALLLGLARIQVLSHDRYEQTLLTQSYKTVRVPALRGKILDRNRNVLADNTSRFRVDLYLEELSRDFVTEHKVLRLQLLKARGGGAQEDEGLFARIANRMRHKKKPALITEEETELLWRQARFLVVSNAVQQVSSRIGRKFNLDEKKIHDHWMQDRALPYGVYKDLTPQEVAVLTEQMWSIRGVTLERQPVRSYKYGPLAAHVLGYLRRTEAFPDDEEDPYDYRLLDYTGGTGLEAAFDRQLRGSPGAKRILVNSGGYRVGETVFADPVPGQNLLTTLDRDLQIVTEKALASVSGDERGAVVVMDIHNGDILSMASAPSYDPTEWLSAISTERYTNYYGDPKRTPLVNRATGGAYNPGSTFKIITGLAALENGLDPAKKYTVQPNPRDPGHGAYFLGNHIIGDRASPGEYDFHRAFIKSSNSYFIEQGLHMRFKRLLNMAHRFHLGEKTHLQLSGAEESTGIVPEEGDADEQHWQEGKLANFSIGQEVTVTPIQMACMISAVANGGIVYYPRLVQSIESGDPLDTTAPETIRPAQVRDNVHVKTAYLDVVRAAMRDDVAGDEGTGKSARVKGYLVCGKTGTAEIKGNGIKDKVTWFTSFAPYESPRYAVIVVVESGASGGGTCAPVARQIYEFLRDRDQGVKGLLSSQ